MSDHIKVENGKLIGVDEIENEYKQILAIYLHKTGYGIAVEESFQEFIKQRDHEEAAQISADIMECLRRSLNTARGVA